ncbi:hypothetical protein [uncultured Massilia sp.]|uniref:hypothetical protein n=1 Tax=uncultured Massilia sp. TaxID=169973 RepID=UPI0025FAB9D8|nr:hypothetical protein [uncultured Massilia sp.]
MNKLLATLLCGLLASGAYAQTKDNDKRSATSAPIGQAVSGHHTTAAGVSGTGLNTDGSANTGSAHAETGQTAAGIDAKGKVTSKSTAVIGVAPGKADNVNAQATNTTAPNSREADAPATGGRGKAGTKAEQEIIDANSTAVKEPAGSRVKTAESAQAAREKRAQVKEKTERKMDARANGSDGGNR